MLEWLPIDLIVEIGILSGPDEYEELAKTSERNAIILQKPHITKATNTFIVNVKFALREEFHYRKYCHSFNDQPAVIWYDGTQDWYKHGIRHRDNLPATIWVDGTKEWYRHGKPEHYNLVCFMWILLGLMYWACIFK
jgi:hypothetical protein